MANRKVITVSSNLSDGYYPAWNSSTNTFDLKASQFSFNILDYGADPTGVADSYNAFQAWSQAISANGGGQGLVPPGTYKIDGYVNQDAFGVYHSSIRDISFLDCKGLHLSGYGAKINLKGDVTRQRDYSFGGGLYASSFHMVQPFEIVGCTNVEVEGFEVNGNSQLVTDAPGDGYITEPLSNCISIQGCSQVFLHNLKLHHSWSDGISIKRDRRPADMAMPPSIANQSVTVEGVEVYACARSNISVHEAQRIRLSNFRSYNAGITGGTISFSPASGIDIEPDPVALDIGYGQSSFIVIEDGYIYNNLMRGLSVGVRFAHVTIRNLKLQNEHGDQQPLILSVPHCSISDSDIDTGTGRIDVGITGTLPGMNVVSIERNLIKSSTGEGLIVAPTAGRIAQVFISNNKFVCNATTPRTTSKRFPSVSFGSNARIYMKGSPNLTFTEVGVTGDTVTRSSGSWIADGFYEGATITVSGAVASGGYNNVTGTIAIRAPAGPATLTATVITLDTTDLINEGPISDCTVYTSDGLLQGAFVDNYVFIPAEAYDATGSTLHAISDVALNHVANNVYETNYQAPAAFPDRCFGIIYATSGADVGTVSLATNERFVSPNNLGIRPGSDTDHDCTHPYGTGVNAVGSELILHKHRIIYKDTLPNDGSNFTRGDLVFRAAYEQESMGWACTTTGTAGGTAVFTPLSVLAPGYDAGYGRIQLAMADANQTPDPAYFRYQSFQLNGALTANRTLTVPAASDDAKAYTRIFRNSTTGGFNIIITTGAGTSVTLAPGASVMYEIYNSGVRNAITSV